jgi:hypothetical protein
LFTNPINHTHCRGIGIAEQSFIPLPPETPCYQNYIGVKCRSTKLRHLFTCVKPPGGECVERLRRQCCHPPHHKDLNQISLLKTHWHSRWLLVSVSWLQIGHMSSLRRPCLSNPSQANKMKNLHLFGALDFQSSFAPNMDDSPTNKDSYADLELYWPDAVQCQTKRSSSSTCNCM